MRLSGYYTGVAHFRGGVPTFAPQPNGPAAEPAGPAPRVVRGPRCYRSLGFRLCDDLYLRRRPNPMSRMENVTFGRNRRSTEFGWVGKARVCRKGQEIPTNLRDPREILNSAAGGESPCSYSVSKLNGLGRNLRHYAISGIVLRGSVAMLELPAHSRNPCKTGQNRALETASTGFV